MQHACCFNQGGSSTLLALPRASHCWHKAHLIKRTKTEQFLFALLRCCVPNQSAQVF